MDYKRVSDGVERERVIKRSRSEVPTSDYQSWTSMGAPSGGVKLFVADILVVWEMNSR